MVFKFLASLRNKLTNLDSIHFRFDILQNRLDALVISLDSLKSSMEDVQSVSGVKTLPETFEKYQINDDLDSGQDTSPSGVFVSEDDIGSVVCSLSEIYEEVHPTKKFAFLLHEPSMLVHYVDVWKALDPSWFSIVTTEWFDRDANGVQKQGVADFFSYINLAGYEVIEISDIISSGIKFEYVVTNHVISGNSKEPKPETESEYFKKLLNRALLLNGKDPVWKFSVDTETYLPLQVGNKQIRYMYGADISDGWSLQSWNEIYDIFLCHGINDEREINKRFKGKTFVMGYPRYDKSFSSEMDLNNIRSEFKVADSKKTLLWMPTLGGEYSSIPLFAEALSKLSAKYNIIVRPHPISFIQEKNFIALLEKLNFTIDRNAVRDMNELFGIADVVLADNGGTPFSAIFLGKNVIFLDVPDDLGVESQATAHIAGSSVMELKKSLPVVKSSEIQVLDIMLSSQEFYISNSKLVDTLYQKYFGSPRGGGAKRVASIFDSL